jgi:hypothetical protein
VKTINVSAGQSSSKLMDSTSVLDMPPFIMHKQAISRDQVQEKFSNYLFIVGAQKAGTTALYKYLEMRSELVGGANKEKAFFSSEYIFVKGTSYYHSLFPLGSGYSWGMDATPEYLYYGKCASRIHAFAPNAKIVVLLREPVSRAFSAYNMYSKLVYGKWFRQRLMFGNKDSVDFFLPMAEGKVAPELGYFIESEMQIIRNGSGIAEPSLIRRGLYAPQLERYIRLFGRQNVLIIFDTELINDTNNTVKRVTSFVGLEPLNYKNYPLVNVREYTVDQRGKELISQIAGELFAKDKLELIQTYGLDVPW